MSSGNYFAESGKLLETTGTTARSLFIFRRLSLLSVRRQNLLDKLASELREDLVHLG